VNWIQEQWEYWWSDLEGRCYTYFFPSAKQLWGRASVQRSWCLPDASLNWELSLCSLQEA